MYLYDALLFSRIYSIYLKYIHANPHHYNCVQITNFVSENILITCKTLSTDLFYL